jgi:DNA-directed RNA polymerase subunit beta'
VLTDAAVRGRYDFLHGLKENVIMGLLVPAGTALHVYKDYEAIPAIEPPPLPPEPEPQESAEGEVGAESVSRN